MFIDKCPVCRAAFEEYVTIKSSRAAVAGSEAPRTGSLSAAGAGVAPAGGIAGADVTSTNSSASVFSI